jgi:hypothetical protein
MQELASKRHVHDGAFESHQRGQGLHLLQVHGVGVTDTAFAWRPVMAVLGTVRPDDLDVAVVLQTGGASAHSWSNAAQAHFARDCAPARLRSPTR